MMAAPDASGVNVKTPFEFTQVPDDAAIMAAGGAAPFTTKHLLTQAEPLPQALLTYVRLDRLNGEDLELYAKRAQKAGEPLHEAVRARKPVLHASAHHGAPLPTGEPLHEAVRKPAPLDALNEVLSLGALRGVVAAMRDGYPTTADEDEALLARGFSALGERKWCAVTLRLSEKRYADGH